MQENKKALIVALLLSAQFSIAQDGWFTKASNIATKCALVSWVAFVGAQASNTLPMLPAPDQRLMLPTCKQELANFKFEVPVRGTCPVRYSNASMPEVKSADQNHGGQCYQLRFSCDAYRGQCKHL